MPNTPRTRLTGVDLSMVSLVPSGDDPRAKTVIFKADPDMSTTNNSGRSTMPDIASKEWKMAQHDDGTDVISKDDLPDEVVEYIEKLEEIVDVLKDDTDVLDSETDVDDDEDDDDEFDDALFDDADEFDDDDEDEDDDMAKADPVMKAAINAAVAKAVSHVQADADRRIQKAERIAKTERDERLKRDFIAKARTDMGNLTESPEKIAGVLKSLHDHDPRVGAEVERILKAANAQIEAGGGVLDEIGKSGSTTLEASLDSAAKAEIAKDGNLTYEQAVTKALEANPALYDEYTSK